MRPPVGSGTLFAPGWLRSRPITRGISSTASNRLSSGWLRSQKDPSGFQRYPQPGRHLFEQREAILPVAEVEGQTSPGSSRASSDVEVEVDSESAASDPSDAGEVSAEDLHLLCLVLDDLLQLSDVRSVVSFVRRQLNLLLAGASNDQASSTAEDAVADL